mmetsp:Transcript_8369/g.25354  ORF Transcript_8369/g.25354 Transcript_8369/m.25354 type:complete len:208 (+) Transcript_8369:499-1122(+)
MEDSRRRTEPCNSAIASVVSSCCRAVGSPGFDEEEDGEHWATEACNCCITASSDDILSPSRISSMSASLSDRRISCSSSAQRGRTSLFSDVLLRVWRPPPRSPPSSWISTWPTQPSISPPFLPTVLGQGFAASGSRSGNWESRTGLRFGCGDRAAPGCAGGEVPALERRKEDRGGVRQRGAGATSSPSHFIICLRNFASSSGVTEGV